MRTQPCEEQSSLDIVTFQQQYLDIIPEEWLILSLSLNENDNTLQIAKLRNGCAPFTLSLPLERQGLHEPVDEAFGFNAGQQELRSIMLEANESSQKAKDASTKASYKNWWTRRSSLDARLKTLLANIEKVWIGGFLGIFSGDQYDRELVARFQQSMQNILDKHLPSRRRSGNTTHIDPIKFDVSVSELFVGLGNPNDGGDFDDAISDLLYFVIDILQFQGERNAYDEVDFDVVSVIKTSSGITSNPIPDYYRGDRRPSPLPRSCEA